MAAKMFAEVVIAGSYKNLSKSTRGATKELTMFEKTAKKISGAISAAFAGIALAGITMITDALIDMTKAAAEDRKSMELLNKTLENNWKATDRTIAGVSEYLDKTSMLVGIVDDDLRPAFSKIARVTKDQTKAQKAFDRVLNISAGTGKDVNMVAQAYSKYLGGNKTALDKLIPGLKDAGNKLGFIDEKYRGMAAVAGKNDPFNLINIALGEFAEKVGTAFLPMIDKLSAWLTSDEAQEQMNKFAESVQEIFSWFGSEQGQGAMQSFLDKVLAIADAINNLMAEWEKMKPLIDFLKATYAIASAPMKLLGDVASNIGISAMGGPAAPAVKPGQNNSAGSIVYNIYGVASGQDVIKAIKGEATKKGRTVLGLLTNG